MSAALIAVIVALNKGSSVSTPTGAAFASTSVVVTDSSGTPQAPVLLTGAEATPWSFQTSVNPGDGTVVATDLDANGVALGASISQSFTEVGSAPSGSTYLPTTGITVTPVGASAPVAAAAAAAVHSRARA